MATMILDGYNVIHAVPELARCLDHSLEAARAALVELCRQYRALRRDIEQLYVVFDGQEAVARMPQGARGEVAVLFTQGEDADERIVSMVRAEAGRSRFVVVSDDKAVVHTVRTLGASVLPAQEFYRRVRPSKPPRSAHREADDKVMPSPRDARQITEELRKIWNRALRQP